MALKDNLGHPKGLTGKLILSGMNMGHSPMAKWAFSLFDLPEKAEVADIGCGGGLNVLRFLERIPAGHVFGVDISAASVEKSRAVNRKYLGTRCEIYQANADSLPFEDGSLDIVTAFETVYFWKDLPKCFGEIKRVLKNNGKFIVVNDPGDPEKHWERMIPGMIAYTPEEIEARMKEAGFSEISIMRKKHTFCVTGINVS